MEKMYKKTGEMVEKADDILLISHRHPDSDTLGSAIACYIWLSKLGKKVTLACVDRVPRIFSFLPHVDKYVDDFNLEKFDLMIVVDAAASYMTNFHVRYPNLFKSKVPVINIDHHSSNDNYGSLNIVDPKASSTTLIIYRLFKVLDVEIDKDMATCLLAGMYGDTGSFMHSNTTKEIYAAAADLMAKGGQISGVTKNLFNTKDVTTLKLWGRVLQNAYINDNGVVVSVIKEDDYSETNSSPSNLSGVIDYLNMVPNTKFSLLVNEDRQGNVKGSFRTRNDDIDLSKIASGFGGGGHPKAAGFSLPGKLKEETRYVILPEKSGDKKILDF